MSAVDRLSAVTAVVPNWETPDYTIRSVQALLADGLPSDRVIVVDNGSEDDSIERFRAELPDCVLVRLEKNIGYAGAANAGVEALPADAYLIVNNDAFVHRPGTIESMLKVLDNDRVGIVVPRLLNPDLTLQPTVKPLDTPDVALVRASGLSRFVPNRWQPRWGTHWDHSTSRPIRAADGAVMLVRRETWDEVGGLRSRNYMYAEDTRICWEAGADGWKVWFDAGAEFVHLGNATAGLRWTNPERVERWSVSEAHLVKERLSPPSALLSIGFTAAGLVARAIAFTLLRRPERVAAARAQLRGYLSVLR